MYRGLQGELGRPQKIEDKKKSRKKNHGKVFCKYTYSFLHLLRNILHIESAGGLTGFVVLKYRHLFHLCLGKRENIQMF